MDFKDMHPEQKAAVNWILNNRVGCLAPECGSGKTVIGLTAFRGIQKLNPGRPCRLLVVSTKQGVRETWANEHRKWSHLEALSAAVLEGDRKRREQIAEAAAREGADVWCISYNNLDWFLNWRQGEKDRRFPFDMIFADEGSCLKGHDGKWRKILTKLSVGSQYRIISTATPAPRDAMDYWGLCKYMDNGECLSSPTITEFRSRYCISIPLPNRVGMRYELKKGATEEIEKKVKHLFYTFSVVKEVPVEEVDVWEKLSKESLEIYRKVEEEQCMDFITNASASLDALSLSNKLAQISNGFVYVNQRLTLSGDSIAELTSRELNALTSKRTLEKVHLFGDRIEKFKELMKKIRKKHGNAPVAIAYLYRYDLEVLERAFPDGKRDSDEGVVEAWNRKEIPYLFLQYARSAKALNLQEGGNVLAVYSPTWNWEHDYQIVRRLARQGQKAEKVFLYRLWFHDTIDEEKHRVLKKRKDGHRTFQKLVMQRASTYKT